MNSIAKVVHFESYIPGIQVLKLMFRVEVVLFVLTIVQSVFFVARYIIFKPTEHIHFYSEMLLIVFPIYSTIYQIITLHCLWKGTSQCSKKHLGWFVIFKSVLLVPQLILLGLFIIFGPYHQEGGISIWIIVSILTFFILYIIYIIHFYYKKLDSQIMLTLHEQYKTLLLKEYQAHRLKASDFIVNQASCEISDVFGKYVISPLHVTTDTSFILGEDMFKTVFRGTMLHDSSKPKLKIAATVLKETEKSIVIEMLLQDIKTLIHVGDHDSIIKFYGITSDASLHKHIGMIYEFCVEGSLKNYLMKNSNWYIRKFDKNTTSQGSSKVSTINCPSYVNIEEDGSRSVLDLMRFSVEIVRGMEHLADKKIIHGDLATRNILLTNQFRTKISDFGITRRLNNYQIYSVSRQKDRLPWRWMSIEAIENLKLSEKSDVWAFGVVLWEIFSLGECPHNDMKWSSGHYILLRSGVRLHQPNYASDTIYRFMQHCWKARCDERPNFSQLKTTLENMHHQSVKINKTS